MSNKAIVILALVGFASCQRYGSYGNGNRRPGLGGIATGGSIGGFGFGGGVNNGGGYGRPIVFPGSNPNVRPVHPGSGTGHGGVVRPVSVATGGVIGAQQPFGVTQQQLPATCRGTPSLVHATHGGSEYHFSWCANRDQKFTGDEARAYCRSLGAGWIGVSIENEAENKLVSQTIALNNLDYIWTSGQKSSVWVWGTGSSFTFEDWSLTGLDGLPQPDNRENNAENCMGILNNFYNDGVKWHDIACHHLKPIICERNSFGNLGVGAGGIVNTGNIYG